MKEILTKSEKEAFEKYIDFKLPNGFRKEDFEFIKMQNPGVTEYPFFLRVRIRDYVKIFDVGYGDLKGMALGQTYTWKELGLYEETLNEGILSDKEKEYLSAVIKPFRDRVCYIRKERGDNIHVQYISIKSKRYDYDEDYVDEDDVYEYVALPYFEKDTMYAGMLPLKEYTLKELGL